MFAKALPSTRVYRYTSVDGLAWSEGKPVDIDDRHRSPVLARSGSMPHALLFYDEVDVAYPYKGWVWFGNWGNEHEGIYFIRSADGLKWSAAPRRAGYAGRVIQRCHNPLWYRTIFGPGDTTRFRYDPASKRFLGIFKFFTSEPPGEGNICGRVRLHSSISSITFRHPTYRPRGLLPAARQQTAIFPQTNTMSPAHGAAEASGWGIACLAWPGQLSVFRAGCSLVKLITSRTVCTGPRSRSQTPRTRRRCSFPRDEGGSGGRNDGGYLSLLSQGPLRIGNELVFYYGATSFERTPGTRRVSGGGIFRARLRVDGFVSITGLTITRARSRSRAASCTSTVPGRYLWKRLMTTTKSRHVPAG